VARDGHADTHSHLSPRQLEVTGCCQARAAAVEAAEHESRLTQIDAHLSGLEARMSSLEARMTITMSALGLTLTLTLAVLAKLFAMH